MNAINLIPEHLKRWERSSNYMGADLSAYFVVLGRHRDSDILSNSNFETALDTLSTLAGGAGEAQDDAPLVVGHFGHWAVGWSELILVRHDAPETLLRAADELVGKLEDYPILDECDFSERECEMENDDFESFGDEEIGNVLRDLAAKAAGVSKTDDAFDELGEWAQSDELSDVRREMYHWACSNGSVEDPSYPDCPDDVARALGDWAWGNAGRKKVAAAVLRRIGAARRKAHA